MKSVQVRVPATTANLGPGFDAMGIALRLYNTTTVARGRGEALGDMASEAAKLFFHTSGVKNFDFHWSVEGDVPRSRGLGSSVTVRLGVLHGLNELAGKPISRKEIFRLCAELEGHPDNAAPGAFGGFCIAPKTGLLQRYPVREELAFVLLIPDRELETSKARAVIPWCEYCRNFFLCPKGTNWHPVAHRFCKGQHVWIECRVLESKPLACSGKTSLYLIQHKQDATFSTDRLDTT